MADIALTHLEIHHSRLSVFLTVLEWLLSVYICNLILSLLGSSTKLALILLIIIVVNSNYQIICITVQEHLPSSHLFILGGDTKNVSRGVLKWVWSSMWSPVAVRMTLL